MISKRETKLFERLARLAKDFKPCFQTGRAFHVAFAISKGHIVAVGFNNYVKTTPDTKLYTKVGSKDYIAGIHAESSVIRKLRNARIDTSKIKLLIVRISNKSKLCLSKPCANCAYKLGLNQFKEVWYSTDSGFEKL